MLFVDESAKQDGWEAFPTQQLTADSYAAELMRGQKQAAAVAAAAKAPAGAAVRGHHVAGAPAAHAAASSSGRNASGGGGAGSSGGGGGGFSLNLGLSGLGLGLGALSGLGFGGGGGDPNALEDLHDIMNDDPLAAAVAASQRRRHSDGSSGDLGGSGGGEEDDWGAPSAPALYDEPFTSGSGGHGGGAAAAAHRHAGAGPSWLPYGSASMMSVREGGAAAAAGSGGAAASNLLSLEPPLWLPDSHASECLSCHLPFRPFTRLRHHCRLCGRIYCSACCHKRALLPPKYGVRTPQRVCEMCACALAPHQQLLAGTLAAAAQPPVQDCPDSVSLRAWLNSPWTGSLGEDVFKAANMLHTMVRSVRLQAEAGLPTAALQGAEGLALLTVARVGAGWSFSFGTGLVVARSPSGGWSAPCAVSAAGLGWGLQLGGELADVLLVLRSREALSGLCGGLGAGVVLGGAASVAVGPMGRHADASVVLGPSGLGAAAYGYSCSKGAFVGLSLESSLLRVRNQVNLDFYGYPVSPRQLLLEGAVPPPPAAAMLYEGIKALLHRFECRRHLVHTRHSAAHLRTHSQPQLQHPTHQQHPQQPAPQLRPEPHAPQRQHQLPPLNQQEQQQQQQRHQVLQMQQLPASSPEPVLAPHLPQSQHEQQQPQELQPLRSQHSLAPPPMPPSAPASPPSAPSAHSAAAAVDAAAEPDFPSDAFLLFDDDGDAFGGILRGPSFSKAASRQPESSYYPECPVE